MFNMWKGIIRMGIMREFVFELVLLVLLIFVIIIGFNVAKLVNNEPKHIHIGVVK